MMVENPVTSWVLLRLVGSGAAAGFLLHQFFKRVELDRYPLSIFGATVGLCFFLTVGLRRSGQYDDLWTACKVAFLLESCTVISLWTNILLYRAFFHPLNGFPGPFGARLSKFWALGKVVESNIRWYQVVGRLQKQYGDVVRTGNVKPNGFET
jgi:hypothetical protein